MNGLSIVVMPRRPLRRSKRGFLDKRPKTLRVPAAQLDIAQCIFYSKEAWWSIGDMDEKVLDKASSQVRKKSADYKKRCAHYLKRHRQYEINHKVWHAWDMKSKKEQLEDEMHTLQQKIDALNVSMAGMLPKVLGEDEIC